MLQDLEFTSQVYSKSCDKTMLLPGLLSQQAVPPKQGMATNQTIVWAHQEASSGSMRDWLGNFNSDSLSKRSKLP